MYFFLTQNSYLLLHSIIEPGLLNCLLLLPLFSQNIFNHGVSLCHFFLQIYLFFLNIEQLFVDIFKVVVKMSWLIHFILKFSVFFAEYLSHFLVSKNSFSMYIRLYFLVICDLLFRYFHSK
jgi:hypothetical protein